MREIQEGLSLEDLNRRIRILETCIKNDKAKNDFEALRRHAVALEAYKKEKHLMTAINRCD